MPPIKIAPSILSADRDHINEEIAQIEQGADLLHVDIMDGKFVPPTTFDSAFMKTFKTKLPLDVHLMVSEPSDEYIKGFVDAGADSITIHVEACEDPNKQLSTIRSLRCKSCISVKPKTPLDSLFPYLDSVDMVLIMTVEPGWGGQKFMEDMMEKVKILREMKPDLDIEVDGGISAQTISTAASAGANVFVAGNAIFSQEDRGKALAELRECIK